MTSAMTPGENWKSLFTDWPEKLPRKGIVLSSLNETLPFRNFWLKDDLLLMERTVPDALGARFFLLGYDVINSVKFIDPLSESCIAESGFFSEGSRKLQQSY